MSLWLLAIAAGILLAIVQYGGRGLAAGGASLGAAILRAVAVTLIVALLLDAPAGCAKPVASWAALDASLSMTRGDSTLWRAARDSVRAARADSVFVFGDSVRAAGQTPTPHDQSSELRPAVERALGAGHPLVVVSDSTYVVNCFRDQWWDGWLKRGWTTSAKKPVANRDLWEPLVMAVRERGDVAFRWVKGHSGHEMNDLVDELAVAASLRRD